MKYDLREVVVCIIGLGHVGLPLAEAFAKKVKVIGFDIDSKRVRRVMQSNNNQNLFITGDPKEIGRADFFIICVPTPVTESKKPDLSYVRNAAEIVGQNMKQGSIVVLESTVYPGVTEEIVGPILEKTSGLKCGESFKVGYSPERINPGDEAHTIDKVTKVVAGMDEETTRLAAQLYLRVTPHIFKAKDIKTAEAAKVIENIQRDLNIALMNELALILDKLDLSTRDVLDAAATKWNFHRYSPGLVGGHCIPVDPYYLVYRAKERGYHAQVILAGRAINDYMAKHLAEMFVIALKSVGKAIKGSKALIMGLTYKANIVDTRETPTSELIRELKGYGIEVLGYDPLLGDAEGEFGIRVVLNLNEVLGVDGVILTVAHDASGEVTLEELKGIMNASPILIDVPGVLDRKKAEENGFCYRTL